jgi:diadenosine tetraphosphate (Ap4A) HIT family hydrolase
MSDSLAPETTPTVCVPTALSGFTHGCPLCHEISDIDPLSRRLGLYPTRAHKILLEDRTFVLMPDISPLVPGHSLIVTKHHVPSLAELQDDQYDELEELCRRTVAQLRVSLGGRRRLSTILFEHGGYAGNKWGGHCIDHAHLHVLPVDETTARIPLSEWLQEYGEVCEIENLRNIAAAVRTGKTGYLFCETEDGRRLLTATLETEVPCQYMRRKLGVHFSIPHWNWKTVFTTRREDRETLL